MKSWTVTKLVVLKVCSDLFSLEVYCGVLILLSSNETIAS